MWRGMGEEEREDGIVRREARQVDGQVGRAVREREGQMKMEEKGRRGMRGRGVRDKGRGGDGERHGVKGGEIRRMQEGRRRIM